MTTDVDNSSAVNESTVSGEASIFSPGNQTAVPEEKLKGGDDSLGVLMEKKNEREDTSSAGFPMLSGAVFPILPLPTYMLVSVFQVK
ncbi:hypothetical protein L1987_22428 [Smallanthus sonchifolius]|uniref:Uncharacterized protein n=1 Tax=Smallanthus sonchifolius TaxID=185202 RepID=A0ACB9IG98_9ASTR|nr:hypothetical protein L1987_22428 [Smallanthus sonchifolius]